MNRPNIEAITARAEAALAQPCHERHQIINPCLSCDADIQRSLRTDIPELIAYIEHLEARLENRELPEGVGFKRTAMSMVCNTVDAYRNAGWNAALRALGYKEPIA